MGLFLHQPSFNKHTKFFQSEFLSFFVFFKCFCSTCFDGFFDFSEMLYSRFLFDILKLFVVFFFFFDYFYEFLVCFICEFFSFNKIFVTLVRFFPDFINFGKELCHFMVVSLGGFCCANYCFMIVIHFRL
ncbi:MAG: hypothetical protein DRO63_07525 [Candidatus Gerdarchaeota archaeon]|nr:MAG: hypothetical protein DRO63_07525 [Candidatus Gerdarchaeota archaeon]